MIPDYSKKSFTTRDRQWLEERENYRKTRKGHFGRRKKEMKKNRKCTMKV